VSKKHSTPACVTSGGIASIYCDKYKDQSSCSGDKLCMWTDTYADSSSQLNPFVDWPSGGNCPTPKCSPECSSSETCLNGKCVTNKCSKDCVGGQVCMGSNCQNPTANTGEACYDANGGINRSCSNSGDDVCVGNEYYKKCITKSTPWSCKNGCVPDGSGKYSSFDDCTKNCKAICGKYNCVSQEGTGQYNNLTDCGAGCGTKFAYYSSIGDCILSKDGNSSSYSQCMMINNPNLSSSFQSQPKTIDYNTAVTVSTTNFWGNVTACTCQVDKLFAAFSSEYDSSPNPVYVGIAVPPWMSGIFRGFGPKYSPGATSSLGTGTMGNILQPGCDPRNYPTGAANNCSISEFGGCGRVFKIDINGVSETVYGIVMDNCGMGDYGANVQWCTPYQTKCSTLPQIACMSPDIKCGGKGPEAGHYQLYKDGTASWEAAPLKENYDTTSTCGIPPYQSGNFQSWKCVNAAGYAGHIDILYNAKAPKTKYLTWIQTSIINKGNPIVKITPVNLDANSEINSVVKKILVDSCGSNSGVGTYCENMWWK
jgi:hypothetical protein